MDLVYLLLLASLRLPLSWAVYFKAPAATLARNRKDSAWHLCPHQCYSWFKASHVSDCGAWVTWAQEPGKASFLPWKDRIHKSGCEKTLDVERTLKKSQKHKQSPPLSSTQNSDSLGRLVSCRWQKNCAGPFEVLKCMKVSFFHLYKNYLIFNNYSTVESFVLCHNLIWAGE